MFAAIVNIIVGRLLTLTHYYVNIVFLSEPKPKRAPVPGARFDAIIAEPVLYIRSIPRKGGL